MVIRLFRSFLFLLLLSALALPAGAAEVNVYSARKENLIKPLLDRFSRQTGIRVNLITGKADALLQRLRREGRNSPADLLITSDAGRLHRARQAGVIDRFRSPLLEAAVPARFRDPEGYWYGLTIRARPIMYVRGRLDPALLSSYEDLADPKWRGRICIRSSNNIYNQSLVASLIAANGPQATQDWARGVVRNMARPPQGGDRDQIRAAVAGVCDIAIANTYYLAGMLDGDDPEQRRIASRIGLFWPNQQGRGAHVNVSGVALTRSARHRPEAIRLIEFLAGGEAQQWYAARNGEYPVRADVALSPTLEQWGRFRMDSLELTRLGELNPEAVRIMDRAGWR